MGILGKSNRRKSLESQATNPSKYAIPDFVGTTFTDPIVSGLRVAAGSIRGRGHALAGESRQDSICVFESGGYLVCAVADGISRATHSELGSKIVTENLETYFTKEFSDSSVDNAAAWQRVGEGLSKQLVAVHARMMAKRGHDSPESVREQRELAAAALATTLEILVIERHGADRVALPYVHIRLAGDGLALAMPSRLKEWHTLLEATSVQKSPVAALPASNETPQIRAGRLSDGDSLLLCTDGIADLLATSRVARKALNKFNRATTWGLSRIAIFLDVYYQNDYDDKSFFLIKRG